MNAKIETDPLFQKYLEKTGKTSEQAIELVRQKTDKFSGLLTEEAALYLLAKEAGIADEQLTKQKTEPILIQQLETGQSHVDVLAIAKRIFPVKEFANKTKPGTGKRCGIILADSSGEIQLTLWHEHTKLAENLVTGTSLLIRNASVTEYNGQKQLNFGYNSKLETNPSQPTEKPLPKIEIQKTKINQIEAGQRGLCIAGTVRKIYPIKSFENDNGNGEYQAFELADDSEFIRCIAWNDQTAMSSKLAEGNEALIENAYAKTSRNGETELHLGDASRIVIQTTEPTNADSNKTDPAKKSEQ